MNRRQFFGMTSAAVAAALTEDGMAELRRGFADQARVALQRYKPFAGRSVQLAIPRGVNRARYV